MALTKNGISTTIEPGTFVYDVYYLPQSRTEEYRGLPQTQRVQWDYRNATGKLFSGIAKTVEQAYQEAANQSGDTVFGVAPRSDTSDEAKMKKLAKAGVNLKAAGM